MKKSLIRDEQRIEHIWHAICRIVDVVSGTNYEEFTVSEPIQEQLFYNLLILGEASNKLSADFRREHDEIPWSKIIGMRNVMIHDYADIDYDIAWVVVTKDILDLQAAMRPIFEALPPMPTLPESVELL